MGRVRAEDADRGENAEVHYSVRIGRVIGRLKYIDQGDGAFCYVIIDRYMSQYFYCVVYLSKTGNFC